ncbi:hypothetical protein SynBIOSE41_01600 [Synechococcus sp. BIOS-E4-1]|nr:hypothetical protein SynBIOSE41_01600 [Synechococcus sp. BIOS-E4-1]
MAGRYLSYQTQQRQRGRRAGRVALDAQAGICCEEQVQAAAHQLAT